MTANEKKAKRRARRERRRQAVLDRTQRALAIDCPRRTCPATVGVWCGAGGLGPWLHDARYDAGPTATTEEPTRA